ncbi:RNA recognition motif 2-domain-containing protein [Xylaria sp. CBS 124048]|nr:RNA recognition motif 2-domain-containing protein [Xylaria sp. CBS 124048]
MSTNPPARDGHFNPASPHSSSGAADSFKGTPDTRLTAFSPEDGSAKSSKAPQSLSSRTQDNLAMRFASNPRGPLELSSSFVRSNAYAERDPFVSSSAAPDGRSQKLSPTASVFLPYPTTFGNGKATESVGQQRDDGTTHQGSENQLVNNSEQVKFAHRILSTDTDLSRCLIIADPGRQLRAHDVGSYLSELESTGFDMHGGRKICEDQNHGDRVLVRFVNIRDSCATYSNLTLTSNKGWFANYMSVRDYAKVAEPGTVPPTIHEGQLYLNVFSTPVASPIESQRLELILKRILQDEGDLFAFKPESSTGAEGSLFSAIAEYCDNDVSLNAVSRLNNRIIEGGFQLCITLYRPDTDPYVGSNNVMSPARTSTTGSDIVQEFQRLSMSRSQSVLPTLSNANALLSTPVRSPGLQVQQAYGMLPVVYHGIPMATPPYVFDNLSSRPHNAGLPSTGYPFLSPMAPRSAYIPRDMVASRQLANFSRRQNATRIARSPHYQQTNSHNHVDVNRIREGTDVRTTIMLRNIPNKVDQAMLKRIVDESSWGKYDFMYLRIDFANDCNVGYAFINFVDPLDIVDFVSARGNQRWNCFKSDKVAEISYASKIIHLSSYLVHFILTSEPAIQGKDCLVQKFRNSSVMLEAPHYRPKLYYTLNGPCPEFSGEEEAFPGPDNQSKMKRSCENAEHVGLFTPNAGQHYRDEQRRRRSQFDRGTRMAEAEELDYDATMHRNFYSS